MQFLVKMDLNNSLKKCSRCDLFYPRECFYKSNKEKSGLRSECKFCTKKINLLINPEKKKKWAKNSRIKNRIRRENDLEYREISRSTWRNYAKKYRISDINFKLSQNLRRRLRYFLKKDKPGSAVSDLGCSIECLKAHLESLFQPGMSWDNYGKYGWHIDHIIPISSFDLTDRKQLLKACHFTNLQPLWAEDNIRKHNKIPVKSKLTYNAERKQ